ncbi:MAG: hypothetical protein ACOQNY_01550 [Mycoplasmoidaceae bacterium]
MERRHWIGFATIFGITAVTELSVFLALWLNNGSTQSPEGEKEILIFNNTPTEGHIIGVNTSRDYDLGNFSLDQSVTPVANMFEISLSIIGWDEIEADYNVRFKNNFSDKSSDTIRFYLSNFPTSGWPVIRDNWEIGEMHPLRITVKDTDGNLYYKNAGDDPSTAFYIQRT